MIKMILIFLCMFHLSVFAEEVCRHNKEMISVTYSTITLSRQSNKVLSKNKLHFWRFKNQVAYEYPKEKFVEVWNLVANGQIKPTRYFDQYHQGIEYQPMDINHGKGDRNWNAKNSIVSDTFREKLVVEKSTGNGCEKIVRYSSKKLKNKLPQESVLNWFKFYELPERIKITKDNTVTIWQAKEIVTDIEKIKRFFKQRDHYQLTDYADIGDSESNPFLSKMINLGFVQHHDTGYQHHH